jgi:hypothetical protein
MKNSRLIDLFTGLLNRLRPRLRTSGHREDRDTQAGSYVNPFSNSNPINTKLVGWRGAKKSFWA